jgi:hypothetical protein
MLKKKEEEEDEGGRIYMKVLFLEDNVFIRVIFAFKNRELSVASTDLFR